MLNPHEEESTLTISSQHISICQSTGASPLSPEHIVHETLSPLDNIKISKPLPLYLLLPASRTHLRANVHVKDALLPVVGEPCGNHDGCR